MDSSSEFEKNPESEPFGDVLRLLQERITQAEQLRAVATQAHLDTEYPVDVQSGSYLMASEKGPDNNDPDSEYMFLERAKQKIEHDDPALDGMFQYGAYVHRFMSEDGTPKNDYFIIEFPEPTGHIFYGVNQFGAYVIAVDAGERPIGEERGSVFGGMSDADIAAELERYFKAGEDSMGVTPAADELTDELNMISMADFWLSRLKMMNPKRFTDA